jgi:hypothetical protein
MIAMKGCYGLLNPLASLDVWADLDGARCDRVCTIPVMGQWLTHVSAGTVQCDSSLLSWAWTDRCNGRIVGAALHQLRFPSAQLALG